MADSDFRHDIGFRYEQVAADYLTSNGYIIMERNWRAGQYEIDIIATRDGDIHIVEVKSRRKRVGYPPEEAMDKRKCNALRYAANVYITRKNVLSDVYFHLIAIEFDDAGHELRFVPNVFSVFT